MLCNVLHGRCLCRPGSARSWAGGEPAWPSSGQGTLREARGSSPMCRCGTARLPAFICKCIGPANYCNPPEIRVTIKRGFGLRHSAFFRVAAFGIRIWAAGGGHCNLDKAATVSMLGVAIVGWRGAGRLGRIGVRAQDGREGCRARVLGCRECRDRGQ